MIVEGTLKRLARHLESMNGSSTVSARGGSHGALPNQSIPPRQTANHEGFHSNQWVDSRTPGGSPSGVAANPPDISAHSHHVLGHKAISSHVENPYSASTSTNSYSEPTTSRLGSYHQSSSSDSNGYPSSAHTHPTYVTQNSYPPVGPDSHDNLPRTTATDFLFTSSTSVPSLSGPSYPPAPAIYLSSPGNVAASGPSSWQYWTNNLASNLEPEEYMSSANALMQLGGHGDQSGHTNASGSNSLPTIGNTILEGSPASEIANGQQRWPLIIFGNEQDGAGSLTPHTS